MNLETILDLLLAPEFYILGLAPGLALDQGSRSIKLPSNSPPLYTVRHVRKILKSLAEKKFLVVVSPGKNQNEGPGSTWRTASPYRGPRGPTGPSARSTGTDRGPKWGGKPGRAVLGDRADGRPRGERARPIGARAVLGDRAGPQLSLALKEKS